MALPPPPLTRTASVGAGPQTVSSPAHVSSHPPLPIPSGSSSIASPSSTRHGLSSATAPPPPPSASAPTTRLSQPTFSPSSATRSSSITSPTDPTPSRKPAY